MTMTRPPALLVADSTGLDFLNSIATPVDTPVEWLSSGDDLLAWLEQTQLVAAEILARFRANSLPGELEAVATQARSLREWFREFVVAHMGKPLRPQVLTDLAPLNRILEREDQYFEIVKRDRHDAAINSGLALSSVRRWRSPETLLLPVASALAELVCNEDFTHVKACEGPTCTLLFLDRTHGHARRWCSMAACGNRAKQAAHRKRARHAAT